jgi:hypothetical protein
MTNNESLRKQNAYTMSKLDQMEDKTKKKENQYAHKIANAKGILNEKKQKIAAIYNDILSIQEFSYNQQKENNGVIKSLQCDILEAEKAIARHGENHTITKQYESHRLKILREKQKVLNQVICKDSYQYF